MMEADAAGPACDSTIACAAGAYCDFPPDSCGLDRSTGVCVPRPQFCNANIDPVCGCDQQTYNNDCEAAAAGQDVAYMGKCATEHCGGFAGLTCQTRDTYCDWTPNSCGNADALGDCRPIPTSCPPTVEQVCGCDLMTYANDCEAQRAGVDVWLRGTCTLP